MMIDRRGFLKGLGAAVAAASVSPSLRAGSNTSGGTAKTLDEMAAVLPKVSAAIQQAKAPGQLYVSLEGRPIADIAWGTSPAGGHPMRPDSIVSWASAVKPCTATCAMQLWEEGKLDVEDRVVRFIPEFAANNKSDVRIWHLLTHTAHLGGYLGPRSLPDTWAEMVEPIIKSSREPYGPWDDKTLPEPGLRSGYNPAGIWILAEICRRIENRPFEQIIRERVFERCGMTDSWCGMPVEQYRRYQREQRFASAYLNAEEEVVKSQPAGGGLGPSRELARFYEVMLAGGEAVGGRLLSPQTIEAMTAPQAGLGYMGFWGFGFNVAFPEGVPIPESDNPRAAARFERYGKHASPRTFGHAGASGMQAFADPDVGLAYACIGRVPAETAVYEDLKLT